MILIFIFFFEIYIYFTFYYYLKYTCCAIFFSRLQPRHKMVLFLILKIPEGLQPFEKRLKTYKCHISNHAGNKNNDSDFTVQTHFMACHTFGLWCNRKRFETIKSVAQNFITRRHLRPHLKPTRRNRLCFPFI